MTLTIFIGIPATGKSTFYFDRFSNEAIRLNLDMLKTRHRERLLFEACLESKASCVIDNTNATRAERRRYIEPAKSAEFRVEGYFFQSIRKDAIARNVARDSPIPEAGIRNISSKLELPEYSEGFDALWFVSIVETTDQRRFDVTPWQEDL